MEVLLLGIYSFFVWLIFIKFKWLPWNIYSQVTVVVIPIVALTAMILALNVFAPSSADVRVFRFPHEMVPQASVCHCPTRILSAMSSHPQGIGS